MPRPIHVLTACAAALLRLAPSRFRYEYGSEVLSAFADMLRDERARRGRLAMGVLWMRGLADLAGAARREREGEPRPSGRRLFGDLGGDVRGAVRSARRTPAFAATIVFTLVFGIGLASAIFAFGDGYLFRSLPYADPDRLFLVRDPGARGSFLTSEDAAALVESHLASWGFVEGEGSSRAPTFGRLQLADRTVPVSFSGIDPGFAELLDVPLVLGRRFTAEEYGAAQPVPIWLSHRFWLQEFGGDPDVVGRRLTIWSEQDAHQVEVVGVTDPRITTFSASLGRSRMLPAGFAPAGPRARSTERVTYLATPIVRLPDDVTVERAESEIAAFLQAAAPRRDGRPRQARLDSLQAEQLESGRTTALLFVLGAALALLLVAINVAHLLLTRGVSRAGELATRAALGASRWRIARLMLVESAGYAAIGVAGGLVLAYWFTSTVAANIPTRGSDAGSLATVAMQFDLRVVMFAVVMGLGMALVGGGWPAWRLARRAGATWRAMPGRTVRLSPRLSRAILASEVAVSSVVLLGAVFCGAGIWRFLHQPLGYDMTDRFDAGFPDAPGQVPSTVDWPALRAAIAGAEGVRAAAFGLEHLRAPVRIGDRDLDENQVVPAGVGPDYFAASGVRLLAGRIPDNDAIAGGQPLAVVDQRLAALAWPDRSALGQTLSVDGRPYDVVGVVTHQRFSLLRETPALAFVPAQPRNERQGLSIWAPAMDAGQLRARLTPIVSALAPGYDVGVWPETFARRFDDEISNASFQQPILIVLALFAFAVAGIGLFGLVSYLVEQRTRDFGIRLALGARVGDITRALARESIVPALAGLAVGLAAGAALQDVVRATMFGWESSGPLAIAIVSVLIVAVALVAVAAPARRVLRIDPATTLRE